MTSSDETTVVAAAQDLQASEPTPVPAETEYEQLWQGYCKFGSKLNQNEQQEFESDLQAGHCPEVTEPALMRAALELVRELAAAGVRAKGWSPAPSADDLADAAAWVSQRIAAARAEGKISERGSIWKKRLARALGQPRPVSNGGQISPVHLQQSRHSLDELARRLEFVIAKHQAEHGTFKREWLDHRAEHYVSDRDGGISNKQIAIMANLIAGRQERRPFDNNWAIVMDWLRDRRAKQQPVQPDEPEKAAQ